MVPHEPARGARPAVEGVLAVAFVLAATVLLAGTPTLQLDAAVFLMDPTVAGVEPWLRVGAGAAAVIAALLLALPGTGLPRASGPGSAVRGVVLGAAMAGAAYGAASHPPPADAGLLLNAVAVVAYAARHPLASLTARRRGQPPRAIRSTPDVGAGSPAVGAAESAADGATGRADESAASRPPRPAPTRASVLALRFVARLNALRPEARARLAAHLEGLASQPAVQAARALVRASASDPGVVGPELARGTLARSLDGVLRGAASGDEAVAGWAADVVRALLVHAGHADPAARRASRTVYGPFEPVIPFDRLLLD